MKDITLGYAFCGSFCTIKKSLEALKELAKNDIKIIPIMSQIVYSTDTRFGSAQELKDEVEEVCGTKIIHGRAKKILTENGAASGVLLENGEALPADSVILATGGMSYPLTGSTGDGYKMARVLGHTVAEIKPSLVALNAHEGFCERLAGLSLKNVTLSVFEEGKKKTVFSELGEMLFTHFGISGPLVLSASAHMRYIGKKQYTAVIDLKPGLTPEQLDKRILRDFDEEKNRDFINSLDKLLPKSLIPIIVRLSCIEPDRKVNSISREQRAALCGVLVRHHTSICSIK